MSKHPIGTLVREEHGADAHWPGGSTWCRIARWRRGPGGGQFDLGWVCLYSDAPGNVMEELTDDDVARGLWGTDGFESYLVVGIVPGSEADRQRAVLEGPAGDLCCVLGEDTGGRRHEPDCGFPMPPGARR